MTDPLGLIGQSSGIGRVGPVARPGASPGQGGPNFKDLLLKQIDEVNRLQQDADAAIEDLQTGKRDDLESVLIATQKADTAFRMLLQVRNKVMDAYEEVKQIRI